MGGTVDSNELQLSLKAGSTSKEAQLSLLAGSTITTLFENCRRISDNGSFLVSLE